MKKFILLFISIVSVGLFSVSCDNDGDNNVEPAPSIVGKWIYYKEGGIIDGTEILIDYTHTEGCAKDYTMFNSNGTVSDVYYDSSNAPCEVFIDEGTYTITGNMITLNIGDISVPAEIVTLTATELKVKTNFEDETFIVVFTKG